MSTPRGRKALLVEDDAFCRQIAESRLHLLGFAVTSVDDAYAALVELDTGDGFDLAVFDLRLPGMDGGELATIVRSSARHRHLPILVVTADSDVTILAMIDKVLHKPYTRRDFEQAVGEVLEKRQP